MAVRPAFLSAAFAASLALLACSPDGAPGDGADPDAAAPASAEAASAALAAFGLDEPGRVTWARRTQDGATFTFDQVSIEDPQGELTAEQLVIAGARLTEAGPLFDRFELIGGRVSEQAGDLSARFDRLAIVEAGPEAAEAVAAALQGREALFDAADPAAGRFGEMVVEALAVTGTSETGQPLDFSVGLARALGHDGERIDALRLEQLRLETADETGAPVQVSLQAVSAEGVASQLAGLAGPGAAPAAPLAEALTPSSQYDRFSLTGLEVRAGGARIDLPELTGAVEEAGEGRLISRTVMNQMSLSADPEAGAQGAQLAQALDQLGYDALNFSLENAVSYDLEADEVQTIEENYLRLEDGFTLRFEQTARGVGAYAERYAQWLEESGAAGQAPPAEVFEPLLIERMMVELEDESLLDRSLGALAQMQGVTPEQLRVQAGAYVALGAAFAGDLIPPRLLSELQSALTGFIGQGGVLTVTMAPEEPVSMSAVMAENGMRDSDALGLSVTHAGP